MLTKIGRDCVGALQFLPDGKNFSLFLNPGGRYRLTPFYDVLTAQPSVDVRHLEVKQMKLAMSVGVNCHYKIGDIQGHHFVQIGKRSGFSKSTTHEIIHEIIEETPRALKNLENNLPQDFPEEIHVSVKSAVTKRVSILSK